VKALVDEFALRNLMATYVDAANRRDGAAWSGTWAEDGVWSIMGMDITGRDNIHALWTQVLEGFDFALLIPSSGQFEIDGDTATGHWYLQEHTRTISGDVSTMISRYLDQYCRVDGQWLYQSRAYNVLYSGPADLSGQYTPLPEQ
jgi:uncharacterized protein (TIGR02246 family)